MLEKDPSKRSDWEVVKNSTWLTEVDWIAINNLKVLPPWKPTLTDEPSANHFVDWTKADMSIPTSATSEVSSYCSQITLPRAKSKEIFYPRLRESKGSPTRSDSSRSLQRQGSTAGERRSSSSSMNKRRSSKIEVNDNDSTPTSTPKRRLSKSSTRG